MMFPEGTRSRTGDLRAFKPGAFELALQTGSPPVPIALDGSSEALPKRGFVLQGRSIIRVHVLPEVDPPDTSGTSTVDLMGSVRDRIAQELTDMRSDEAMSSADSRS